MPVDPLRHPDLARLGRRLRDQLDRTLEAEQHAARAAARRRRTLRDILLSAEDRERTVLVSCTDGQLYHGVVSAVGADHVVLAGDGGERFIAILAIASVEIT